LFRGQSLVLKANHIACRSIAGVEFIMMGQFKAGCWTKTVQVSGQRQDYFLDHLTDHATLLNNEVGNERLASARSRTFPAEIN
jgi:hypothetical protein